MGGSAYGDSKLAVAGLTVTFARPLDGDGIRVNPISPGLILTETIRAELPEATTNRHWRSRNNELVVVISGELTVVTDDGEEVLGPGGSR
jgi:NAD(P)-dependent dehydrogenase (short-subunit alcohol dehydrogenase family)